MTYTPEAKIVLHSRNPIGEEVITLQVDLYKLIVAEVNTHKRLSRNYQSSRAVPVLKVIEQVLENPVLPLEWVKNQSGMSGSEYLTPEEVKEATKHILEMRDAVVAGVRKLCDKDGLNLHKQCSNRYLEPWMSCVGILTATKDAWEAFLELRDHPAADPQISWLAKEIKSCIESSTPRELNWGEWHLPFITDKHSNCSLEDKIKISNACIAQVSYRKLDDSVEKCLQVYDRLMFPTNGSFQINSEGEEEPPHYSPSEAIVMMYDGAGSLCGNLWSKGFVQYRKLLEQGSEKHFINMSEKM